MLSAAASGSAGSTRYRVGMLADGWGAAYRAGLDLGFGPVGAWAGLVLGGCVRAGLGLG